MEIIKTFGNYVEKWCENTPDRARWLLTKGWEAQDLKFRLAPSKKMNPSDQYLARMMMNVMLQPLKHPDQSVLVSVFTPCELMQEAGLYPYNVESFSCYLTASSAERAFLQSAEDSGLSETLCSYHKTFIGAAEKGLLPKPKCIVYTNLACDANLLTFQRLAEFFHVPVFSIDVPSGQTSENVAYVAAQLRALRGFLEQTTGHQIDEGRLVQRVKRGYKTLQQFDAFQSARADRFIPSDLVSPLYSGMTNNILLGSEEEALYTEKLLQDVKKAPPKKGKHIYWMHTLPFWSDAVKDALLLNDDAQIVGCELSQATDISRHSEDPYEEMAMRLIYHALNGPISRRINAGIRHAKQAGADGVVWFNHWGCKHTLGGSRIAKKCFEEAGLPTLILDGDGCDRSHGGEGQTSTRLGAFLEMLGDFAHE